ncbi:Putative outer membrane protein [hydrothermal vent metagenome]|uniref:Outer membrane protein n=1 Tax=hydrothermal vent metagenome TaxID=652676 RepID=A0A3B0RSI2_9ZZZZ
MKQFISLKPSLILATALFAAGPALAQSANWTGAYIGAEIGGANLKASFLGLSANNDDVIGGIIAGYDYDLGTFVIGAGADIDFTDNNFSAGTAALNRLWRLKLRGGYKIGNGLLYATGGYANAYIDTGVGSDGGYFIGGGYEHQIMPNFSVGGEVLYHDFNSFNNSGVDIEVISYQIRAAYRF